MQCVVLIGMPAAGKSAAGRALAEALGLSFSDGDDLLRAYVKKPLSALLAEGEEAFLSAEEAVLCGLAGLKNTVFAPGGSAVYSERAMRVLKSLGPAVYLKVSQKTVEERIPDFAARGVVMRGEIHTAKALYEERTPLYERYADVTVNCDGLTLSEVVGAIRSELKL